MDDMTFEIGMTDKKKRGSVQILQQIFEIEITSIRKLLVLLELKKALLNYNKLC